MKFVSAFVPLLLMLAAGTGLDQWSKSRVSASLATEERPIPLRAARDGETPSELVESRFPGASAPLRRLESDGRRAVMRLNVDTKLAPGALVFSGPSPETTIGRTLSIWVFEGESLDSPPRRLPAVGQLARDLDEFAGRTLLEYLRARFTAASDEHVVGLARDWSFAVDYTEVRMDDRLAAGEVILVMDRTVSVIDGLVQLRYAENPGAGWGLLAETPLGFRRIFFQLFTTLAMTLLLYIYLRGSWFGPAGSVGASDAARRRTAVRWAVASLLSGALGNFIDRVRFDYVIDFVDIYTGDLHWPTFNVADVLISLGAVVLIGLTLFINRASSPRRSEGATSDRAEVGQPGGGDERAHEG